MSIRQLQTFVSEITWGIDQRFLYLMWYFKRKVREAIESRAMLLPYATYERACWILQDLFGRSHQVARSLLDGLFKSIILIRLDADAFSGLAVNIGSCQLALEQREYTEDLISLATLEKIVMQLPYALQKIGRGTWIGELSAGGNRGFTK